jgi:hypothetical protein
MDVVRINYTIREHISILPTLVNGEIHKVTLSLTLNLSFIPSSSPNEGYPYSGQKFFDKSIPKMKFTKFKGRDKKKHTHTHTHTTLNNSESTIH